MATKSMETPPIQLDGGGIIRVLSISVEHFTTMHRMFWSTFLVDLSPTITDATLANQICVRQVPVERGVWAKTRHSFA